SPARGSRSRPRGVDLPRDRPILRGAVLVRGISRIPGPYNHVFRCGGELSGALALEWPLTSWGGWRRQPGRVRGTNSIGWLGGAGDGPLCLRQLLFHDGHSSAGGTAPDRGGRPANGAALRGAGERQLLAAASRPRPCRARPV